ncbi:uncharacterized protein LOC121408413 [Lytechinus variegatus]|uniref:uncharacterized protein LOC121408413 n=1 Tax=Lytechinus variegatus TaxID=7654 RepID=UPI001BB2C435|nr:uncharacterized protein LOC121408413 [Lytechinus variegatus]
MCLPCGNILGFLPLLWIIAMPVVGSFCGPETALRFSLLMMLYSMLESFMKKFVNFLLPVFTIGFFVVIMCLPISIVPYPLVWLYGQLIWITEPLILFVEAIGVIRISMRLSKEVTDHIDDHELLAKGLIITTTVIAYTASFIFAISIYRTGSQPITCILLVIILVSVIHLAMTIKADHGIISNCSIVCLCMIGSLCAGVYESNLIHNPLPEPKEWSDESFDHLSLVQLVLSTATSSMSHVTKATRFLYKLVSPVLISLIVVRTVSIQQVMGHLLTRFYQYMLDDEENEMEEESYLEEVIEEPTCLPNVPTCLEPSALPTKLSLIFVYTQLVFRTMSLSGGHRPYQSLVPAGFREVMLSGVWNQVGVFRMLQICTLGLVYPLRLHREGEEDDAW